MTTEDDQIHEAVRERYARSALQVLNDQAAACCDATCCGEEGIGAELYSAIEREELPSAAVLASLGCGNPTAVAELREGERVLDLGSGGGIDVLLSARRVGERGRAIGLDMTDEMLELAHRNAREAGVTNVEFLKGQIEAIPLPTRLRRRRDQQLRDQPCRRQGCSSSARSRGSSDPAAGSESRDIVADDDADSRAARGARLLRRLHSASTNRDCGPRGSQTSA